MVPITRMPIIELQYTVLLLVTYNSLHLEGCLTLEHLLYYLFNTYLLLFNI